MPLKRIPIVGPANKDLSEFFVTSGGVELLNAVIEFNGTSVAIKTRPGLVYHRKLPVATGIDGIFYWESKRKVVVVAGGGIYAAGALTDELVKFSSGTERLNIGPCQFAATANHLYIASTSGRMMRWDGESPAIRVADEVAPVDVSSIATHNNRMLAVERGTNRVWYTLPVQVDNPTAPLEWSGYFDATRTTDSIQSLMAVGAEILLMRNKSVEFWYDDGVTPFRPVSGAAVDIGISSPRAVIKQANTVFWLSSDSHFYAMTGRQPVDLGKGQIDDAIQNITSISDVIAAATHQFVIFTFTQASQSWVFDIKNQVWYSWSSLSAGRHKEYRGRHAARMPGGRWLLGGYDGWTYFMFNGIFKDGESTCQLKHRTPHYDLGSIIQKQSSRVLIKVSKSEVKLWYKLIELPDAVRCHAYSYTLPDAAKTNYTVSGLPDGFSYDASTKTITSNDEDKPIGVTNVTINSINEWGASHTQVVELAITDFDPEITYEGTE